MSGSFHVDAPAFQIDDVTTTEVIKNFQFGKSIDIKRLEVRGDRQRTAGTNNIVLRMYYSFDNVNWSSANQFTFSDNNLLPFSSWTTTEFDETAETQVWIRFEHWSGAGTTLEISNVQLWVWDENWSDNDVTLSEDIFVSNRVHNLAATDNWFQLDEDKHFQIIMEHVVTQTIGGGGGGGGENPTSTNIISGNVQKLGLPFQANVVCVSIGADPQVVGSGTSDANGDYSIDVYPHTEEVLIYVAPDYGDAFNPSAFVSTGHIVHPTFPNKYVYVAQNDGTLDITEPSWPEDGEGSVTSNEVTLLSVPLHRPLMQGFIKPTVTPIP